ncbi:hypothetical protein D3C79_795650 [compost metagenome]
MLGNLIHPHLAYVGKAHSPFLQGRHINVIHTRGRLHQRSTPRCPGQQRFVNHHRMKGNDTVGPCQLPERRGAGHLDLSPVITLAIKLAMLDIVHPQRINHQNIHVVILLHLALVACAPGYDSSSNR